MTNKEVLENWLSIGFQQSPTHASELFYFDQRDNQFFSLLITDYFLFDEEFNLAEGATTTYSRESLECLEDRVKRIVNKDPDITIIPRFGEMEAEEVKKQVETFLKTNKITLDTATIWEPEGDGTITIEI